MTIVNSLKNSSKTLKSNAKHFYSTSKILAKKHAPLALAIASGVGFVATAVTAYQSAKKVDKTLTKYEVMESIGEEYSRKDMAIDIAKDIATPVILGATSTACLVLSYTIQNNRLKAVTAALAVVTEEHERYRLKAKEILDEEVFKKLDAPVEKKVIKTEEGEEKEVEVAKEGDFYGRWFVYSREYTDDPSYNEQWVRSVEEECVKKIMSNGVLMYNELMDMLGFDNISNSLPFGWTDNDGFFLEYEEHITWNDKIQDYEPQLYIRWTTPRNLYSTVGFKDLLKGAN